MGTISENLKVLSFHPSLFMDISMVLHEKIISNSAGLLIKYWL